MTDSPPPEEQKKLDAEAKAKEDAEQAALPYKWSQTIKDVDITIPIPANLKGRDLNVKFTKTKLFAAIKGQDVFIDVGSNFSSMLTELEREQEEENPEQRRRRSKDLTPIPNRATFLIP